jgi:hypothetical protein
MFIQGDNKVWQHWNITYYPKLLTQIDEKENDKYCIIKMKWEFFFFKYYF